MEAAVRAPAKRHPLLAAMAAAALALSSSSSSSSSTSVAVDAFAAPPRPRSLVRMPSTRSSPSSSSSSSSTTRLGVSIGLGPESDGSSSSSATKNESGVDDGSESESTKKFGKSFDPYDPDIVVRGEDGLPLPHITDFEPYRKSRMSQSDRDADAWFASLLESPGGDTYLGSVSAEHMDRLITKAELVDDPVLRYGEDEDWTPYVIRRLPTSPLYPAYGLETYGLPVLRRGAEAWRHFDVNGLVSVDYSSRPEGIGTDYVVANEIEGDKLISSLRGKGAWLDDDACHARLVYVDGRFCPVLSKQTDLVKNLDPTHFESGSISDETLEYLSRLPDGFTDRLAADVPDSVKGALTSYERLSGPDHSVGKATSQFAINAQQGTAAFAALNSVKAGCVAYIESVAAGTLPVLVVNAQTPSGGGGGDGGGVGGRGVAIHPRALAVARERSVLSLVQMCVDLNDDGDGRSSRPTLVNGYTQIYVGRDANVTHAFVDESGGIVTPDVEMSDEEATLVLPPGGGGDLPRDVESKRPALRNVNLQTVDVHATGDNGSYVSTVLGLGGCGRSRLVVSASLLRPGSSASINGFVLSGGAQRADMRTNIHHVAQGTTSRQEQRNMVGGRSTASFRGRIRVEQSAQQTDSKQLSRTVLLSDHARIWSTPSLEIVADDVQCTHGATVSDLSEEELFYLRSRGLDRITARNVLMYAFVEEIGSGVDESIMGGYDDENGLRRRIIRRLENVVPKGEKALVGGEFQSV